MRSVPIVAVKPSRQVGSSFSGGVVSASICPFAQARLDEALGLSVGLWRIGLGEDVLETEAFACLAEGFGTIAGAVVGHDALHLHTEARIVGDGRFEEGDSALFSFILHDAAVGDAGGIVDADMHDTPSRCRDGD